jgi:hypothetical protein
MNTMTKPFAAMWLAIGLAVLPAIASAQLWDFDAGSQGWRVNDMSGSGDYINSQAIWPVTWNAIGGNPGGFISAVDPSGYTFMFEAPSAALGDYSSFLGGKLNFSLTTDLDPNWSVDSVVVLKGGAADMTIVAAITPQPTATWSNYSIALTANQFFYNNLGGATVSTTDFQSVLGGLKGLLIDAEYHSGVEETTGLDSVAFVAASTGAVPEPSTYGLLAAVGLLGLVGARRFAKRR